MRTTTALDPSKKMPPAFTPARGPARSERSPSLTPPDRESRSLADTSRETASRPSLSYDFSQISIHPLTSALEVQALGPTTQSGPLAWATPRTCHTCPTRVQTKLTVHQPGDVYEQEADRVAEQITRMLEPHIPLPSSPGGIRDGDEDGEGTVRSRSVVSQITPLIQRQAEPEEEEEQGTIQAKRTGTGASQAVPDQGAHIGALEQGGGQPLSKSARTFFEPRFGYDFSRVQVHADTQAAESARALNAQAYTVGRDIVFGAEQYAPETKQGRLLLAHELTHVAQQSELPHGDDSLTRVSHVKRVLPSIQRETASACIYGGCTAQECPQVSQSIDDAWDLVMRALDDLEPATRGQPLSSRTRDVLTWHFRTQAQADIETIRDRLLSILPWLLPLAGEFRCTTTSHCAESNVLAFAGPSTPISLCQPRFFRENAVERAVTVVHEAAHRAGLGLGSDPDVYIHVPGYRALSSSEALGNPDSYAYFARDNRHGVPSAVESDLRLSTGAALQSGQAQFYVTFGPTFEVAHPVLSIVNPVAGVYATYMPESGAVEHRLIGSADVGLRLARARPATGLYLDVRGGGFVGTGLSGELDALAGLSARLAAGYRSDRLDLGVDFEYWHNFLSRHPGMTLIGVRAQLRF